METEEQLECDSLIAHRNIYFLHSDLLTDYRFHLQSKSSTQNMQTIADSSIRLFHEDPRVLWSKSIDRFPIANVANLTILTSCLLTHLWPIPSTIKLNIRSAK